jgi:hypothetical protein
MPSKSRTAAVPRVDQGLRRAARPAAHGFGARARGDAPDWCCKAAPLEESPDRSRVAAPLPSLIRIPPELPLTPLGLTPAELAQALGRYRSRLHALIHALGSAAPMNLHNDAFPVLEDLSSMVDVDIGARSAPSGAARMSEVERAVLVPLLGRLHERLARLTRRMPARDWIPVLQAADEDFAYAERALVGH